MSNPIIRAALAVLLLATPIAASGQTVNAGYTPYDDALAGVRFRSFNNTGGGEVYLGVPGLGTGSNRVEINIRWAAINDVVFVYDPALDLLFAQVVNENGTYNLTYQNLTQSIADRTSGDYLPSDMNIMQLTVANRDQGTTVNFNNVLLNSTPLGDFIGVGFLDWMIEDFCFGAGFVLQGTIELGGTFSNYQELSAVKIRTGVEEDFGLNCAAPQVCGNGSLEGDEECDDGNTDGGDCCSAQCTFESAGSSCGDGDLCNGDEVCDGAGTCQAGVALDCNDQNLCTGDSCDPQLGCVNSTDPVESCRNAGAAVLVIVDKEKDRRDRIAWRWTKGATTSLADFSDPMHTAEYAVCIYSAGTANGVGRIEIPPGTRDWKALGDSGFRYKNRRGEADGIRSVILRSHDDDRARARFDGKGENLPDLALPLELPVTVQLVNDETGICWSATYEEADVRDNRPDRFNARAR